MTLANLSFIHFFLDEKTNQKNQENLKPLPSGLPTAPNFQPTLLFGVSLSNILIGY